MPSWTTVLLSSLAAIFASVLLATNRSSSPTSLLTTATTNPPVVSSAALPIMTTAAKRMPAYFISHGGPPTLFETQSKPYKAWVDLGKKIIAEKPKGIVVVSAHWENEQRSASVLVNDVRKTPLVYDFYGFPKHFYEQTFDTSADPWLVDAAKQALEDGGVAFSSVGGKGRGLDHGVWIPFKVLFPKDPASDIPIVQISLPGDSSSASSLKLGLALEKLRDQQIIVVGTGQAVHNLRDYMMSMHAGPGGPSPSYGKKFLSAISEQVKSPDRLATAGKALTSHADYRKAHPTPEHLLPLFVAMGAGGKGSEGSTEWDHVDGALSWGIYRFD